MEPDMNREGWGDSFLGRLGFVPDDQRMLASPTHEAYTLGYTSSFIDIKGPYVIIGFVPPGEECYHWAVEIMTGRKTLYVSTFEAISHLINT